MEFIAFQHQQFITLHQQMQTFISGLQLGVLKFENAFFDLPPT